MFTGIIETTGKITHIENELSNVSKSNNQTDWKNPGVWIGIIMGILVLWGMYKIVMMLIK